MSAFSGEKSSLFTISKSSTHIVLLVDDFAEIHARPDPRTTLLPAERSLFIYRDDIISAEALRRTLRPQYKNQKRRNGATSRFLSEPATRRLSDQLFIDEGDFGTTSLPFYDDDNY